MPDAAARVKALVDRQGLEDGGRAATTTTVPSDAAPLEAVAATSRAVERALDVLCAFSRETPTLGVTELSERLGLTKSTVHRALQALLAHGLVTQDPAERRYSLGYRVLALAQAVPGAPDLRHICHPHMRWLQALTQETVALYVPAGDVRLCLDELESSAVLRMSAGIGRCFPLPRGAAGKALLVDGPAGGELWRSATARLSAGHLAVLSAEVAEARTRGYTASMGETVDGAASIAAPLRGPEGGVIAALSVGGPATRFGEEAVRRHTTALLEAAAKIQRDLAAASMGLGRETTQQRGGSTL